MNLQLSRNQPRARYLGSISQPIKISFHYSVSTRSRDSDPESPAATPPTLLSIPVTVKSHPSSSSCSYILLPFPASFFPLPENRAHPNIPSPFTASDRTAPSAAPPAVRAKYLSVSAAERIWSIRMNKLQLKSYFGKDRPSIPLVIIAMAEWLNVYQEAKGCDNS